MLGALVQDEDQKAHHFRGRAVLGTDKVQARWSRCTCGQSLQRRRCQGAERQRVLVWRVPRQPQIGRSEPSAKTQDMGLGQGLAETSMEKKVAI